LIGLGGNKGREVREDEPICHREEEGKDLFHQYPSLITIHERLTLEIPRPLLTPNPRRSHHNPAPAIPANPVPDDQAPRAVRDVSKLGRVVVFWRNVNSPRPDEREARAIPKSRGYKEEEKAIV
jgi:hypothetical protein